MKKLTRYATIANALRSAREIVATRWGRGNYITGSDGKDKSDLGKLFGIPDDDDDDYHYCGDGAARRSIKNLIKNMNLKRSQAESLLYDTQQTLVKPMRVAAHIKGMDCDGKRSHQIMWDFNDRLDVSQEDILAIYDDAIEEQCRLVREEAKKTGDTQS